MRLGLETEPRYIWKGGWGEALPAAAAATKIVEEVTEAGGEGLA